MLTREVIQHPRRTEGVMRSARDYAIRQGALVRHLEDSEDTERAGRVLNAFVAHLRMCWPDDGQQAILVEYYFQGWRREKVAFN